MRDNIIIEVKAGRLSQKEGQKQWTAVGNIIPDAVRAQLTVQQRQTLSNLLGKPYLGK